MNLLLIARKELLVNFRDIRTFLFMLAFPVVLMLILGTALTNAFSNAVTVGELKLLVRNTSEDPHLSAYWDGFAEAAGQGGLQVDAAAAGTDGRKEVSEGRYAAYAEIGDKGISFYGSPVMTIESGVLEGMLTAFADRYNLAAAAAAAGHSPQAAAAMAAEGQAGGFIRETALDPDRKPDSLDYYAIAMTTMIAFYAAMSAGNLMRGERLLHTADRLAAAPVGKWEIFAGKVLGSTFVNFLCVFAVVLFSKYVFGADWGGQLLPIALVLLAEVLFAVSVGLAFSYLLREGGGSAVVAIFAQIAAFLGGAYFPLGEGEGFGRLVQWLSPMKWANEALNRIIYAGETEAALPAIGLFLGFAAVFLALSALYMSRREAI